jgi:hypothetical protein
MPACWLTLRDELEANARLCCSVDEELLLRNETPMADILLRRRFFTPIQQNLAQTKANYSGRRSVPFYGEMRARAGSLQKIEPSVRVDCEALRFSDRGREETRVT